MRHILVFILLWLMLTAAGGVVGYFVFHSARIEKLAANGVQTEGEVISKNREEHAVIEYSFTVDGKKYNGFGRAGDGNPDFDQIGIGQQVIVTYDPVSPELSYMGYPQFQLERSRNAMFFVAILFPVFPIMPLFGIYWAVIYALRERKRFSPSPN